MPSLASRIALAALLAATSIAAPAQSVAAQSTQTPAERDFNQGEANSKAKNWASAIVSYKAAVSADPSFAAAYYSLGLAYYENKDPKSAAAAFKMYLKYKPNEAPALLLLGIALRDAGDNAGAVDALQSVINLKPEAKYLNSAYYNMGVAYENAHQLPEAMQTYIVLRTISPDDAQDLLDYMRSVDPDLKAVDASPAPSSTTKPSPARTAGSPAVSVSANFNSYKNTAGNYSINFPGQPKESALPPAPNEVGSLTQSTEAGVTFTVTYAYNQAVQTVDEATFNAFRDRFLQNLATCQVLSETAASPALANYQSKAYRLSCVLNGANKLIIGNLYWGEHYSYGALTISLPSPSDPPAIRKFLDSFALIDPAK